VFTVEQRNALHAHVLTLAETDPRIVAGAAVGSLALGGGDRFSDLDLTFAVDDNVPVAEVLSDWTRTLSDTLAAVHLSTLLTGPRPTASFCCPMRFNSIFHSRRRPTSSRPVRGSGCCSAKPPRSRAGTPSCRRPETSSGGVSSTACTRTRASNAGVSGRRSTTSVRSVTTRSRSPASVEGYPRSRHAVTTTSPLRPSPASTERTWPCSSLSGSAARSRLPCEHSCASARRPMSPASTRSRSECLPGSEAAEGMPE
jgi:hypothetical protein